MATMPLMPPMLSSTTRRRQANAEDLVRRYEVLKQQRSPYEYDYQDIVRLLLPGHDDVLELTNPGQSRTEHIMDSHPLLAPQALAGNMMGTVTNQALQWRRLKFRDETLNETQNVNGWLRACDTRILSAYAASNFYQAAHTYYLNLGGFGTAAMYAGTRMAASGQHLHFKTLATGSYVIAENADGLVDTLCRELWYTPRQAQQLFKGQLSPQLQAQVDRPDQQDRPRKFLHCVYPRVERDDERYDNKNMPFAGIVLELETKFINEETGYQEFPFLVSRWETMSRSAYGFGPGHLALPDVRMLNVLRELHLQQLTLWVQPPLMMLQEGVIGNISLESRAVNVVRQMDALKPMDLTGRPDLVQIDQAGLYRSIDDCFYVNALQALPPPDASNMTAYEVAQRIEQMTRLLGPAFYRLLAELLNPLEDRVFGLMWRAHALPPVPREVMQLVAQTGGQIDVEYENPLVRSQRGTELRAITDIEALGARMVETRQSQDILDNIDFDLAYREAARVAGVPRAYIRDTADVLQMRRLRQQQQAQMQQAQMQNERMSSMGRVAPLVSAMQEGQGAGMAA
jgi:hypothetical protein